MAEKRVQRRLAAILAADVVGYSRLMEADEEGTLARLKVLRDDVIDSKITEYGGRIFKTTGDGLFAEFPSAVDAVRHAVDVQRAMEELNAGPSDDIRITLRIGISLGDVMVDGDDLFGNGVNVAARMEGLADAGGICVSGNVQEHIGNTLSVTFEDLGEQSVKNINRPIRVYRVVTGQKVKGPISGLKETLRSPDKPSIAILPFANRSHGEEHDYLAEGIAEDIITKLSKLSGLFVIGGNSSAAFMDKSIDARRVGQELDVKYLLEGAVQRSGERVRISVKLVDTEDNHNLWTDRYDHNLIDVFDLQDEVANEVVNALELELSPAETDRLSQKLGGSLEVYNLYQQARAAVNPPSRSNTLAARSILQHVVELAPNYAPGFAGLSLSHARAVFFGHSDNPDTDLSKAFEFAEKALSIDKTLGICHSAYARACHAARQFDEAVVHSEHAVEIQPGDADSYGYLGVHLAHASRALEAVDSVKRALEIEPTFIRAPYMNQLGFAQWAAFQYEEAIETLQRNLDRGGPPHTIAGHAYWTACLVELNRMEDAIRKAKALHDGFPEFTPQSWTLGHWYKDPQDTERLVGAILKTGVWD